MVIHQQLVSTHLNYFSCLEDDIAAISRWIEISIENENTYSIELARLLMVAAAEVDVIAKDLCKAISPQSKAKSINAYQSVLTPALPALVEAVVEIPKFGMTFQPWSNWRQKDNPPDWWTGYNKVKHHRAVEFSRASLKNVLDAVSALLLLVILQHRRESPVFPRQRLFVPRTFVGHAGNDYLILIPDGNSLPWA